MRISELWLRMDYSLAYAKPIPMRDFWYKNAIVYSLDVETFMDANGDGIGDFQGLTQRLPHLERLGITCLWLLPFYPSPNRDNGYDVMDYYNVDPRLGTLGDFVEFMVQAKERGIRVLIDLVVNHTSDQHPWFQAARRDRHSPYRDYYVWSEQIPKEDPSLIVFPDKEDSLWDYDEQAGAYYLHHFYQHQPDLNISNPAVQDEIRKIMGFWLALGVSGFRVDAAPFLIKGTGIPGANPEALRNFLREMREFLSWRQGDAILLAEANEPADELPIYFGDGDRMQMLFNFLLNQYMFLALARQNAAPLQDGLKMPPAIPQNGQWLNFVRHHDELTLDKLSKSEQQEIFQAFAPEAHMQIFDRGIRRRLPPMLQGDRRRIELVYSLAFSLPGTPLLRYGDEIGMGDDLSLEGRTSVRTAMQWSNEANGGFSNASPNLLARPVISEGDYSYKHINVAEQKPNPNSLMRWLEELIRTRKQCPAIGCGEWQILETDESAVFAHACEWQGQGVMVLHNLADRDCLVRLKNYPNQQLVDLFGDRPYEISGDSSRPLELSPYGYRWFRINCNH